MRRKDRKFLLIVDIVAISHYILCNVVFLLLPITGLLKFIRKPYPGLAFVYTYIDVPIFQLFQFFGNPYSDKFIVTFLIAQAIFIFSSVFYGLIAGIIFRSLTK